VKEDEPARLRERQGACTILAALETQLAALDAIGAHLAAAHLDAAIAQLRRDLARRAGGGCTPCAPPS
jgi:hypothetical protein